MHRATEPMRCEGPTMNGTSKSRAAVHGRHGRPPAACSHVPTCPPAHSPAFSAARVVAGHPEQGWSLLCNGVVLFDDGGALLPDGRAVAPVPHAPAENGPPLRRGGPVKARRLPGGRAEWSTLCRS